RYSATPFDDLTSDPCFKQDKCTAETFIATKVIIQKGIEFMDQDMCKEHPYKQGQTECKTTVPTDPVVDLINDNCFKKITKDDEMCMLALVTLKINAALDRFSMIAQLRSASYTYKLVIVISKTMLIPFCLTLFIAAVTAGIPFKDCGQFELKSVEVSGCTTSPCTLHKGNEITININYTASADSIHTTWELHAIVGGLERDLSRLIPKFDSDGCHDTPCPIKKGETKMFTTKLTIPVSTPTPIEGDIIARLLGDKVTVFCGTVHGTITD
ncbi:unnamed protein product, partial [Medioppia subpectinata]